jgi:hypothetical protein
VSNLILPSLLGARLERTEPYTSERTDEAAAGNEYRSAYWTRPRHRYVLKFDALRADSRTDLQTLRRFFGQHLGRLDSFLIQDPEDYSVSNHGFGVGDGTATVFQLQRSMLGGNISDLFGGPWPSSSKPRTNMCIRSEAFDDAAWTKSSTTVSANAAIAPDGNLTADKLVEVAATAQHLVTSTAFTVAGETNYSIFAKAAGRTQIVLQETLGNGKAAFDLSAGTVLGSGGLSGGAAIFSCGSGWYRCMIDTDAGSGSASLRVLLSTDGLPATAYAGNTSNGAHLWGALAEVSLSATAPGQYFSTAATAVVLTPTYWQSGYSDAFEPCTEVLPGPSIRVAGVAKAQGTDYTVAFNSGSRPFLSGQITFTSGAPANGAALDWSGSFLRRVRFADSSLSLDRIADRLWSHAGVNLVQVI